MGHGIKGFKVTPLVSLFQLLQILTETIGVVKHNQTGKNLIDLLFIAGGIFIDNLLNGLQRIMLLVLEQPYNSSRNHTQVLSCIGNFQLAV